VARSVCMLDVIRPAPLTASVGRKNPRVLSTHPNVRIVANVHPPNPIVLPMKDEEIEKRRQLFADIMKNEFTPAEQSQLGVVEWKFGVLPVGPERLKVRFRKAMLKKMKKMLDEAKRQP
jgi:hypothetical protein